MHETGLTCRGNFNRPQVVEYSKRMSKGDLTHLWNDTVAHILQQQGFFIEECPRSIYEPEQLWTALSNYSPKNDRFIDPSDEYIRSGIAFAWKVFAKPKDVETIGALRTTEQVASAIKMEKFSGLPAMTKKRDDFMYAIDRESQIRKKQKAPNPCLAGKRTQKGNKTRLVWMYPLEMTIMEARFARPLIDRFLDRRTTMAFGMKKYAMGAIIDSICFQTEGTILAMDYSKFDSSIPSYFIKQAFKILGTWFSDEDKENYGFKEVERYFLNTPLVMIDGKLYTGKKHGVPSGSYFTQMIDSIVNTMLLGSLSKKFKWGVSWTRMLVLGDDVIIKVQNPDILEMKKFLETYGINLNVEKTSNKPHFLGAEWYYAKPFRNFSEILSAATQPETFKQMGKEENERRVNGYNVLVNYAATYTNAWRMLSARFHSPRNLNFYEFQRNTNLLSDLQKLTFEEFGDDGAPRSHNRTTLIQRFLA